MRKGGKLDVASHGWLHYPSGMNRKILFALLLLPGLAHAVICKSVDSEGVVSYTKVPASECPEPVKLPAYSTFESRPIPPGTEGASVDPAAGEVSFEGYKTIKILQPEADGVVRSNEGKVAVTIALEPALRQGHRVALHIDGKAVQGAFDGLAIELSGIERGTHSVRASVSDADGKLLIESPAVSFTLRQTGLFDSVANTPGLPIAKPVARPRPGGR